MLTVSRLSLPRVSTPGGIGVLIALLVCLGLLLHTNSTDGPGADLAHEAAAVASAETHAVNSAPSVIEHSAPDASTDLCLYLGVLCVFVTLLLTKVIAIRAARDDRVNERPAAMQAPNFATPLGAGAPAAPLQIALRI